ncbi:MAG: hypothetical protein ACJAVI_005732 [Candidatus Azotimanducaceae bacterium]|jgi:hypothetical protein
MKVDPDKQPDPPGSWVPAECYWFCYGSAHDVASKAMGSRTGDLGVAKAISAPNTDALPPGAPHGTPSKTSGAIEYYGIDGVCHNVANQVLYCTGTSAEEPLRVKGSSGYPLVMFLYGNYGLNASGWYKLTQKLAPNVKEPRDDFVEIMHGIVPDDQHMKLLSIRLAAQSAMVLLRSQVAEKEFDYDSELQVIIVCALGGAYALLGKEVFLKLFPGIDPNEVPWLKPSL